MHAECRRMTTLLSDFFTEKLQRIRLSINAALLSMTAFITFSVRGFVGERLTGFSEVTDDEVIGMLEKMPGKSSPFVVVLAWMMNEWCSSTLRNVFDFSFSYSPTQFQVSIFKIILGRGSPSPLPRPLPSPFLGLRPQFLCASCPWLLGLRPRFRPPKKATRIRGPMKNGREDCDDITRIPALVTHGGAVPTNTDEGFFEGVTIQTMDEYVHGCCNFKFQALAGSQKWAPVPHLALYGLQMGPFWAYFCLAPATAGPVGP